MNLKLDFFLHLDGLVLATPEGPAVDIKSYPTDPYAFFGGVQALSELAELDEPTVKSDSQLPDLPSGGIEIVFV